MIIAIVLLAIGLIILIFGAEYLVRGSASLAKKWGISSLVIGLTVVSFGTSMPELIVNMFSTLQGSADMAIGNVVGSNISNILLILGVSAIIYPLRVKNSTIWKEIPFALLAMILIYIMGNDVFFDKSNFNTLSRTDGLSLIAFFIIFMFYIFGMLKKGGEVDSGSDAIKIYSWRTSFIFTLIGLISLFFGGKLLVDNAVILARLAGLSEALIGLTIVAVGTSLPELATSVIAALHKQDDIAVGNIVGSNIFNVFWILGLTATALQIPFNQSINIDVLVGILASLLLFIFMFISTKHKIDRWQGIVFVSIYLFYIVYLINRG